MKSLSTRRTVAKFAAATVVVAGLSLATAGLASAAEPTATATPSTGLADGATVSVTATGFAAGADIAVDECAAVNDTTIACAADMVPVSADASGNVAAKITVNSNFQGYNPDGTPSAAIDCKTIPGGCFIGVSDSAQTAMAKADISFS